MIASSKYAHSHWPCLGRSLEAPQTMSSTTFDNLARLAWKKTRLISEAVLKKLGSSADMVPLFEEDGALRRT